MRTIKILIIEDDSMLRELYTELLTSEGYNIESAPDGSKGLEKMKTGGWDIILLDIMLPIIDGFEILEILKQTPPPIPNGFVVFLTNLSGEEMQEKGIEMGGKAYWKKSEMTPGEVVQRLKGIVAELPAPTDI